MKRAISSILQNAIQNSFNLKLNPQEIENYIEIPPESLMGDFAFPCFFLASKLRKNPNEISLKIKEEIKKFPKEISEIKIAGAYLNFFINKKILAVNLINEILREKEKYGSDTLGKGKKVIVEFSSPNIAKPFGIGHLRSTIIGNAIANLYNFKGYGVIRINYLGDWGTQFGKLIAGYKKYGDESKLKKDPAKHLLEIYVKANKEEYEEESRAWFKKLERGDKEALKLWEKFKKLSLKDFGKLYKILGIKFDVYSGESMCNKQIPKTIEELKSKNLLVLSEGAFIVDLKKFNLGVCLIQKSDGSTIYAARDIASAIMRHNKYKFDKMIYEVGQEQKLHFQQVFKVLELMEYPWAKNCFHAEHGLYLAEDGKKFATRKGKTIFMEDIINETESLASKEIKKRFPKISKNELKNRAHKIAIAAIFYGDLKNNRTKDMVFDIDRFVSFDGDTGPYIQYSYARANSILKKSKIKKNTKNFEIEILHPTEIELIKKLFQFKEVVLKSYETLNPSLIAHYSYQLAQSFNEFYHSCSVVGSKEEKFRIKIVESFKIVLKNSLSLLGIETLEEM